MVKEQFPFVLSLDRGTRTSNWSEDLSNLGAEYLVIEI